jgi:hypothetical protein
LFLRISQYHFPNAAVTIAVSIIYAITYGCATIPTTAPPSPKTREQFGRIGVVALSSPIHGEFYTQTPKGKTAGALTGAAEGAVGATMGVWAALSIAAGTVVTPAAIISAASVPFFGIPLLIVLGAGAIGVFYATGKGAADGEARAVPKETAKQIEQQIDEFLTNMKLSSGLAEAVYAAGASKRSLAKYAITLLEEVNTEPNNSYDTFYGQGIKTILEVSVTDIGFQEMYRSPPDPLVWEKSGDYPIKFYLNARTRLIEAVSDTVLYTRKFQYEGSYRPLTAWLETSGQGLELEFKQAQANLAERIIQELFLSNVMGVARTEEEDKRATDAPPAEKEKAQLASIPKDVAASPISLRRQPMEIFSETQITRMLKRYGFFERSKNSEGSFNNQFVDNKDGTVTDYATGLMWQKEGSSGALDNNGAHSYVEQLNRQRFAGYYDWRMPTIEELASLLERTKPKGVHMDPLFDSRQVSCWSADKGEGVNAFLSGAWIVNFGQGQILEADFLKTSGAPQSLPYGPRRNYLNHVKAVRWAE